MYNYGVKSRKGENKDGSTKYNQDSCFFKLGLNNDKNMNVFGVMDGHGSEGHLVSQFIKNNMIINLEKLYN